MKHNKDMLGLESDDELSDLHHYKIQDTDAGTTVRYHQVHQGIPVYESDLVITFNHNKEINFVTSTYKQGIYLELDNVSPQFSAKEVIKQTRSGLDEDIAYKESKLTIVYQKKGPSKLVWKLDAIDNRQMKEIEILIDANNARLVQIRDKFDSSPLKTYKNLHWYSKKKSNPTNNDEIPNEIIQKNHSLFHTKVENTSIRSPQTFDIPRLRKRWAQTKILHETPVFLQNIIDLFLQFILNIYEIIFPPLLIVQPTIAPNSSPVPTSTNVPSRSPTFLLSRGNVYEPDPIASANSMYGKDGLTDDDDEDSAQLNAQLKSVVLSDIEFVDSFYFLKGPWAEIVDTEEPKKGLFKQSTPDFSFHRNDDGFEAVNCYYHIDKIMRYINDDLQISVRPEKYNGGVRFDPHGFFGGG